MAHTKQIEWMDEIRSLSAELNSSVHKKGRGQISVEEQLNSALVNLETYQEELRAQNEELTRAREATEALLSKYSILFDNSPVGYFIINTHSAILEANSIGAEMLGKSPNQLDGKPLFLYLDSGSRRILEAHFRKVSSGAMASDEVLFSHPTRGAFPVLIKSSPLNGRIQKNALCLTALFDISERKVVEDALLLAKEDAEFANRSKSEFLAIMAHELRSPLNAIIGFSECMTQQIFGPVSPSKYQEYAGHIFSSGSNLLGLVNNLLDLEKVEAGKMELSEEPFELSAAIEETLILVRERAKNTNLLLVVDSENPALQLLADKQLVKQMLLNLVTNAIKFTDGGGRITISSQLEQDGGISLSVKDTGVGIAEEDFSKIMLEYGQATAGKHKGTGLGLPIVKSMIELHGGSFKLESTQGEGTTATLLFPPEKTI